MENLNNKIYYDKFREITKDMKEKDLVKFVFTDETEEKGEIYKIFNYMAGIVLKNGEGENIKYHKLTTLPNLPFRQIDYCIKQVEKSKYLKGEELYTLNEKFKENLNIGNVVEFYSVEDDKIIVGEVKKISNEFPFVNLHYETNNQLYFVRVSIDPTFPDSLHVKPNYNILSHKRENNNNLENNLLK